MAEIRPMKRRELEMTLQSLSQLDEPSASLEQYPTPSTMASDILFIAKSLGDVDDKAVMDLGCGNGIFAIGAGLMGAGEVVGVDIDEKAVDIARKNAAGLDLEIEFRIMDIRNFEEKGDVVFQNPPFGSQKKRADRPFLEKAMELADVVYTIHMSETRDFIEKITGASGFRIDIEKKYKFEIRHTFKFHKRERAFFDVTLFRLVRGLNVRV
ncbi:MAG: methyltransferase [Thermoplasmata archaeon]|nr:methyltransferase [Thermoplasmata archaeon]